MAFGDDVVNDAGKFFHGIIWIFYQNAASSINQQLQLSHLYVLNELTHDFILNDQNEEIVNWNERLLFIDIFLVSLAWVSCYQTEYKPVYFKRVKMRFLMENPLFNRVFQILFQTVKEGIIFKRKIVFLFVFILP